jgi:hypothetical protein
MMDPNDSTGSFFELLLLVEQSEEYVASQARRCSVMATAVEVGGCVAELVAISERHRRDVSTIFTKHRLELGFGDCASIKGLVRGSRADLRKAGTKDVSSFLYLAAMQMVVAHVSGLYETIAELGERLGFAAECALLRAAVAEKAAFIEAVRAAGQRCLLELPVPVAMPRQSDPLK